MLLTVTDTIGEDGSVTVESSEVANAILGWYVTAPEGTRQAVANLQSALDVGDLGEGWANYLGVTVELAVPKA